MKTIPYEITNGKYTRRDTIILNDDEVLTDEQIEAIKQERFNKWLAIITAVPDESIPADPVVTDVPVVDPGV